jgi:hypothetical protein
MKGSSVPEPPPINNGEIVPDALINYLNSAKQDFRNGIANLINLIHQRDAFGRAKYGQPLMTKDGRNGIEDAKQELGDLLQYLMKCKLAGEEISEEDRNLFLTGLTVIKILL